MQSPIDATEIKMIIAGEQLPPVVNNKVNKESQAEVDVTA